MFAVPNIRYYGNIYCLVTGQLHHHAYRGRSALTAHSKKHKDYLLHAGADVVLLPFRDAAKEAADMLVEQGKDGAVCN